MENTDQQYDKAMAECRDIFVGKMKDYGASWRIFRPASITDQLFIKANRIRSLEEKGVSKVGEGIYPEYIGLVNYSIMQIIQLENGHSDEPDLNLERAIRWYNEYAAEAKSLMEKKNHDYGEAWRDMRVKSLTDLILVKILRIKEMEDNQGQSDLSEGIDANLYDMINYSIFALIKLAETKTTA
ncbi:DUF1599 domain-containing protein [Flavobacteriales bacterium]|nr:DUF1599 domain-containing protein [Flavobacteriales bacterium]